MSNHRTSTWRAPLPLALLCVIVGSRWLVEGEVPGSDSTLPTEAMGCMVAAGCFGALGSLMCVPAAPGSWRSRMIAAFALASAFTGPALAVAIAGTRISSGNRVLAAALTPIIVTLALITLDHDANANLAGLLWPGLGGVAGLLLLLPEPSLTGVRQWVGFVCLPLITGTGAVVSIFVTGACVKGGAHPRPWLATSGCFLASAMLFVLSGSHYPVFSKAQIGAYGLDALTAFLSVYILINDGPRRWSAQFLLIPFLALAEGFVFLRPVLATRSWVGLALLFAGGLKLLLPETRKSETHSLLRFM